MTISDDQWHAELHKRMSQIYAEKIQCEQASIDLGEQVKSLKAQISTLEGENRHRTTFSDVQQSAIQAQMQKLVQALQQKTDEITQLRAAYHGVMDQNTIQGAALEQYTNKLEHSRSEAQTRTKECEEARAQAETLQNSLVEQQGLYASQSSELTHLRAENAELQKQMENHQTQVKTLTTELGVKAQSTSDQIARLECEKKDLYSQVEDLKLQVQQLKYDLSERQQANIAEVNKASQLEDANKELTAQLTETKTRLQSSTDELERMRADKDSVGALLDTHLEKINEQVKLIAQQKGELEALREKNSQAENSITTLNTEIASLKAGLTRPTRPPAVYVDKAIQVDCESATLTTPNLSASRAERPGRQSGTAVRRFVTVDADKTMPAARCEFLESFPTVDIPLSASTEIARFSRPYLSACLGGGMQGVVGTFDLKKERRRISLQFDLYGCLYPQRHLNPWLPPEPGAHGYLFLGLKGPGKDHERFLTPTTRALFIHEKSGWKYFGLYVAERNPERDLTVDEWNAFSDEFKDGDNGYCAMTLNKSVGGAKYTKFKDGNRSLLDAQLREVRAKYDTGELRVPCISLKCIGYSEDFVEALKGRAVPASSQSQSANVQETASCPPGVKILIPGQAPSKRKRTAQDTQSVSDTESARPATRARCSS